MVGVRLAGVAAVHPTQSALALGEEAVTVNAVCCRQHSNNSWRKHTQWAGRSDRRVVVIQIKSMEREGGRERKRERERERAREREIERARDRERERESER